MRLLPRLFLLCLAAACSGTDPDPTPDDVDVDAPPPTEAFARFTISHAGVDTAYDLHDGGGNAIRCEQQRDDYLYLSFGNYPIVALDLDVHGAIATGRFDKDGPRDGAYVYFTWHDHGILADSAPGTATPCTLDLTRTGTTLTGELRCAQLRDAYGRGDFAVSGGSFRCTLRRG